jgi:hypothetical protein
MGDDEGPFNERPYSLHASSPAPLPKTAIGKYRNAQLPKSPNLR